MIHRVLRIGRWTADFLFANADYDDEGVIACLYSIGADYDDVYAASRIMDSAELNCGFTFANPDLRRALVVVGPTSSSEQFLNTFTHEIYHLAAAIAESLGYDIDGEGPAYIAGDSAMALARTVCALGCPHCSE